jgi:hypothetical protein
MKSKRKAPDPNQEDLFGTAMFPVRQRLDAMRPPDLSLRIKTAMGKALKECADSATIVAAHITDMTGRELTTDALYAYTAPSKPEHSMDIIRFVAFVRATGATWLWDVLVEDDGLIVMEGKEAHYAQLGVMRQRRAQLDDVIRDLEKDLKNRPAPARRGSGAR